MCRFREPVKHGIGHGGVLYKHIVLVSDGQLACDDGGFAGVPVLDEIHEVKQLLAVENLHPEVLDDEQFHLGHAVEELGRFGLDACHLDVPEEFAHVVVAHLEARQAGLVTQSRCEVALAHAGRAGDEHGGSLPDVLARGESTNDGFCASANWFTW